ncbi:RHS repeat-associated core domain-containing protein [Flavobacterium tructae]|uniref:RHS repeat-associated core domain-containing protein n=1 Tax=Flavobacterium tructae TaxID=1114873 RepID=UPI0035A8BCD5
MARFRHFFLNIWSQQIEDDKNTAEIEKFAAKYTNNTTRLGEITIKNDLYDVQYINNTNKSDSIYVKNQNNIENPKLGDYFDLNGTYTGSDNLNNKYKFNEIEFQDELGLNMYNYGARNYTPVLGRWMNIAPLAETSRRFSPYVYANNIPVYFIDPNEMGPNDIIVLSYGKNANTGSGTVHRWGHQAILVGDDKKGWTYYSLDGDWAGNKEDGSPNDSYTIKTFDTLEQFTNSEFNTFKNDYDDGKGTHTSERYENGEIKQRYTEGYRIETTDKQDKDMEKAARAVTEEGHNMATNNCTAVPEAALNAAGLSNGEWTLGSFGSPPIPNFTPNAKQAEIERSNKGQDVDEKLKRN